MVNKQKDSVSQIKVSKSLQDTKKKRENARKEEEKVRLSYWRDYFQSSKNMLIILGYHSIILLKTIREKNPKAQFFCEICEYSCNDLEVVKSHIDNPRHINKLKTKLVYTTSLFLPRCSAEITELISKLLISVFHEYCMRAEDIEKRYALYEHLKESVSSKLPGCKLKMFGSSVHGMGLRNADINFGLCVNSKVNGPSYLTKIADILGEEKKMNVKRNFATEVPHVSFEVDGICEETVECKISLCNENSVKLAVLLKKYAMIDPRVKQLCTLFRLWGQMCSIDKQNEGTWPSYSLYILVMFFLQQVSTPVVPVLQELMTNKKEPSDDFLDFNAVINNWEVKNKSNLGSLWLDLFQFYTVDFDRVKKLVCIHQKKYCYRKMKMWGGKKIAVIDPFLQKRNVMRSVSDDAVYDYIDHCLHTTYNYFAIPQTSKGPIFGFIHDIAIDDLGLKGVSEYIKKQEGLSKYLTNLILEKETVYKTPVNLRENDEELQDIIQNEFVNIGHYDIDTILNGNIKTDVSNKFTYKDLVVSKKDAALLLRHINPKCVIHYFDKEHIFCLTGGKTVPLCCSICHKQGHIKLNCPEENLPPLNELAPLDPSTIESLNKLCEETTLMSAPTKEELYSRCQIVHDLQRYLISIYPDAELTLFGSSCNGFGLKNSDLDICLRFKDNTTGEGLDVQHFIEFLFDDLKLYSEIGRLICIQSAKVPIIKFVHKPTGTEGDISLYNSLALENTNLLWTYSEIDQRVKELGYMMKSFVKLCKIGDASKGSLSSYSYTLMVIYFLQHCDPPVLPVLQELYKEGEPKVVKMWGEHNTYFFSSLKELPSVWPSLGMNQKSVGELWVELLKFYTEKFNIIRDVISIRSSTTITKFSKLWISKCIAIEDPFNLSHNLGSALSRKMNIYIIKAFRKGRLHFGSPIIKKNPANKLREYYFDPNLLGDIEPPNDHGCFICKSIGHRVQNCPEKNVKPFQKKRRK